VSGRWVFAFSVGLWSGCTEEVSPYLQTPVQALEYLREQSPKVVYFNGPAHWALVRANPSWLAASDRDPKGEHVRAMAQAVQDPKLFRQLDRQDHFDALLLAGDPGQYKPLVDHLVKTGDWALEWVDAYCLIYKRGSAETISMERIRSVTKSWETLSAPVQASLLAALSEHLVAARRGDAAREMLDRALGLVPNSAAVLTAEGGFRLARGEWGQAVDAANKALSANRKYRPALSVKAQGLYFSKRFGEAYEISSQLLRDSPNDPVMLFAHAKIAHEVRAFQEEIGVLQKLIGIVDKVGRSTSWYRVYLGQAFALKGDGEDAVRELELALKDPELPAEQREFAEDALQRVVSKIGGAPSHK